ncbi:heavy metal-associated isoprenylated plant protein 35-like [Hibiscus syriacus]|uniref:heavy metal-associated isoprenylated plant protein 35-like n=1 Tax=Hibiscus syriacus TaxID=106335 RepID=UPI0019247094|nr:heavy metal-associated isoprenylated plant protein 35-like [Hibiscus syriacus]
MAANQDDSGTLKFKTCELKVFIHCQGCRKKVKKVLQALKGVYETTIDSKQQKVTVTGCVDEEFLIKRLSKLGKYVEPWPEMVEKKEKKAGKSNNNEKQEEGEQTGHDHHDPKKDKTAVKPELALPVPENGGAGDGEGRPAGGNQPQAGYRMAAGESEEPDTKAGSGDGRKKKEKVQRSVNPGHEGNVPAGENQSAMALPVPDEAPPMESINGCPPNQGMYRYGDMYYGPQLFGGSYNTNYHSSASCYYAPRTYSNAYGAPPAPPPDPIDGFNDYHDDDETGCSLM